MKIKLLTTLLVLNFSFNLVMAQSLPTTDLTPLSDGLNTEISLEATQEMGRWARSAKTMLEDLKSRAQGLSTSAQVLLYEQGIDQVVLSSGGSRAQLLMRFALNRAKFVANLVATEAGRARGVTDFKLNIYRHAIELALEYYESDLAYLGENNNESVRQPYAKFGIEFANLLLRLNRNLIDISAQYKVMVKALEFLRSDLQADLDAQAYAVDFTRLDSGLGISGRSDTDALMRVSLRDLKRVIETLSMHDGHGFLVVPVEAVDEAAASTVSAPQPQDVPSSQNRDEMAAIYAIQGQILETESNYQRAFEKFKAFSQCVRTGDFWAAYRSHDRGGQHGTANGIYNLCLEQTNIHVSCITENFFKLALDFANRFSHFAVMNMEEISSRLDISGYGINARSALFLGRAQSQIVYANGHSRFYYTDRSLNCRDDHFGGCKLQEPLPRSCKESF